jgi:hypothetical protein
MNKLNHRIQETLQGFEALETIEPTAEWQQSLMHKLATTQQDVGAPFSTKAMVVVGLLFIALNIGFIAKEATETVPTLAETSNKFDTSPTLNNERAATFETISNELFINPTSIKH